MELKIPISPEILKSVSYLDHFRGRWAGGLAQVPRDRLERLAHAVRVQSVASSCRLAGIRASDAEVGALLLDPETPLRDRAELLGYAAAVSLEPREAPLLDADRLRELHAVMTGAGSGPGGTRSPWRAQALCREVFTPEGTATGRVFQTLPPRLVEEKTEELLTWLELELREGRNHPLLVVGTFVLALLAVSPFEKGNGRISRLLAVRLLRRVGYEHLEYASLERAIEETRDAYYDAYDQAETKLWTGEANFEPWLEYFLGALTEHSRRAHSALDLEVRALRLSPLQSKILDTIREHGNVDATLLRESTGANRNTLKDNMRKLVRLGLVDRTGERRGTRYRLGGGAPAVAVAPAGRTGEPVGPRPAATRPLAPDKPLEP